MLREKLACRDGYQVQDEKKKLTRDSVVAVLYHCTIRLQHSVVLVVTKNHGYSIYKGSKQDPYIILLSFLQQPCKRRSGLLYPKCRCGLPKAA